MTFRFDEINYWSEVKLAIIREYASAYSRILRAQHKFKYMYIDAFAGGGFHFSKASAEIVKGSPQIALDVKPKFDEYHFIELDGQKVESLNAIAGVRNDVFIYSGDCNHYLVEEVFPKARYEDYKRALCLLDPYGLHLDWRAIQMAGQMRSVEIFLNFPVADMNRNVLWRDSTNVDSEQVKRMDRFWGDQSWREAAYNTTRNLFGFEEKTNNEEVAEAFRRRLIEVAGFKHVPKPMPMRNSKNAVVYYLFFASNKPVASEIVNDIFAKYSTKLGG